MTIVYRVLPLTDEASAALKAEGDALWGTSIWNIEADDLAFIVDESAGQGDN